MEPYRTCSLIRPGANYDLESQWCSHVSSGENDEWPFLSKSVNLWDLPPIQVASVDSPLAEIWFCIHSDTASIIINHQPKLFQKALASRHCRTWIFPTVWKCSRPTVMVFSLSVKDNFTKNRSCGRRMLKRFWRGLVLGRLELRWQWTVGENLESVTSVCILLLWICISIYVMYYIMQYNVRQGNLM